jgi:putative glutamine amidotransferase
VIGLCTAVEQAQYGAWDVDAFLLQRSYVEAVQRAGGVAEYGSEPHTETDDPRSERDEFEIALARRAMERDMPLLGICRGMQLMNVARGGTLVQDLPVHVGHEAHRRSVGTFDGNDHPVRLEDGSLAARAAGEIHHRTLSHHHQGIAELGNGLEITGWAEDDALPEAVEDPRLRFALGVQWHPEADPDSRVVAALVEAARRR